MESIKSTKKESERNDESNFGHSEDEWGTQVDIPKIRFIEAYDVKWNIDKKKGESNLDV